MTGQHIANRAKHGGHLHRSQYAKVSILLLAIGIRLCNTSFSEAVFESNPACYLDNMIMSCSSGIIVIKAAYAGAKLRSNNCEDPECCVRSVEDCVVEYDMTTNTFDYRKSCNGEAECSVQAHNLFDVAFCGSSIYRPTTSYMWFEYHCINENSISMCDVQSLSGQRVFLWNKGYRQEDQDTTQECACSIQTDQSNSGIQIHTLHRDLDANSDGSCGQRLSVHLTDESVVETWNCSTNPSSIESKNITGSTFIYIARNFALAEMSRFYIGFEALGDSASVQVQCPVTFPSQESTTSTIQSSTATEVTTTEQQTTTLVDSTTTSISDSTSITTSTAASTSLTTSTTGSPPTTSSSPSTYTPFADAVDIGEELRVSNSACFGPSTEASTIMSFSCSNGVIAISAIYAGAKPISRGCPLEFTSSTDPACCETNDAEDCIFEVDYPDMYGFCQGRQACNQGAANFIPERGTCNTSFPITSTFMFIEYHCIQNIAINEMCSSGVTSGETSYIQSQGFPDPDTNIQTTCACSISGNDVNAAIDVNVLHIFISNNTDDDCPHSVSLHTPNDTVLKTWNCDDNTYTITKTTITDNPILYLFHNMTEADRNMSFYWIGFQGNGEL